MQQQFEKYIAGMHLEKGKERILLTVSGGRDSMCMLYLFIKSGFEIGVAHCNFGLRGAESDGDEVFVTEFCAKNNVPIFVKRFDTAEYAEAKGISIQMAARDLRYDWFNTLSEERGYDYIATAHHRDDVTETFLINLIRGTGIAGLHGILPVSGKLIRPLLFAGREEITAFLNREKVAFRDDSSNDSVYYLRNKIRHEIIPVFENIEPSFSGKINETANVIRKGEEIILKSLDVAEKEIITKADGITVIDKRELMCKKPTDYYLYHFLKPYGFTYSQTENILDGITGQSGKEFLSHQYKLIIGRKGLIIQEIESINENQYFLKEDFEQITHPLCLKMKQEKINPATFTFPGSELEACLDKEKLKFPLLLRKWQEGDTFFPLGMDNKKLLSDFFIDEKFEIPQKTGTWLLLSQDDIVWIVGHRIDHRYRITDSTKEIIRLSICKQEK
jgi:tRNA(Ile)-lysidine synthase